MNDKEKKAAEAWISKQRKKKKSPDTAIGGRFSYIFTPTGIGTAVTIRDGLTGEEKNITDYDTW